MRSGLRARPMLSLGLALATLAGASPAPAAASAPDPAAVLESAGSALRDLGDAARRAAQDAITRGLGACSRRGGVKLGEDGRLTVLLLGSDYRRRPYIGERMDTVLVVTRRPSGRVAMASIPRDTSQIQRASWNGGGTSGSTRVNAMYYYYKRSGVGLHDVDCRALNRFRADVATTLGTEIDHYAMVRMRPMSELVDSIGPIRVDVPGAIVDSHIGRGVFFPARDDYKLVGHERCRPRPAFCRSALTYARSRYGSEGDRPNSDFRRALRQQDVVFRTAVRVRARGSGPALKTLVGRVGGKVYTDLPTTLDAARQLYGLIGSSTFAQRDGIVFAPSRWAYADATTPLYSFRLDLPRVRGWIDRHFGS